MRSSSRRNSLSIDLNQLRSAQRRAGYGRRPGRWWTGFVAGAVMATVPSLKLEARCVIVCFQLSLLRIVYVNHPEGRVGGCRDGLLPNNATFCNVSSKNSKRSKSWRLSSNHQMTASSLLYLDVYVLF